MTAGTEYSCSTDVMYNLVALEARIGLDDP